MTLVIIATLETTTIMITSRTKTDTDTMIMNDGPSVLVAVAAMVVGEPVFVMVVGEPVFTMVVGEPDVFSTIICVYA